ncbi:MAG: ABC transporter ATP-binding protein [Anaerolineales bacterium]|nr:ABC transporter ATP-binding protein [Anaerolineales bacterium]
MLMIERVTKAYEGEVVLREVSLSVAAGEVTVLLGPSGCGKTTLLRIVAGLEKGDGGRVLWDGVDLAAVPPFRRNFGFVFQEYALFPHKNVAENVAFGLRMAGWDAARVAVRVRQALTWVGLADLGARQVQALSGGEQQRVALARSLAPAPRLLLLDEPLGALDRALRERLLTELRPILLQAGREMGYDAGITALYVTHDQSEAFALADTIVLLNAGRVEQQATPQTLYHHPATPFVARFLGMSNLLAGRTLSLDPARVQTTLGEFRVANRGGRHRENVTLLIRPEAAAPGDTGVNVITGLLHDVSFRGRFCLIIVQVGETRLHFELDATAPLPPVGQVVTLSLRPEMLQMID